MEVVMSPMGKRPFVGSSLRDLDERMSSSRNILAKDRFDQPVFLFENDFALRWFADKYPDVELEEKMWLRYQQFGTKVPNCWTLSLFGELVNCLTNRVLQMESICKTQCHNQ